MFQAQMSNRRHYSISTKDKVWAKASTIHGKNSDLYRRDVSGNQIYKPSYGKSSEQGWHIDHKKPLAKDGKICSSTEVYSVTVFKFVIYRGMYYVFQVRTI